MDLWTYGLVDQWTSRVAEQWTTVWATELDIVDYWKKAYIVGRGVELGGGCYNQSGLLDLWSWLALVEVAGTGKISRDQYCMQSQSGLLELEGLMESIRVTAATNTRKIGNR